jgi:hypothetical protein
LNVDDLLYVLQKLFFAAFSEFPLHYKLQKHDTCSDRHGQVTILQQLRLVPTRGSSARPGGATTNPSGATAHPV